MAAVRVVSLTFLITLCALAWGSTTATEPASADQRCGKARATNPQGRTVVFRSVARRLGCPKAESVVRRFWRKSPAPGDSRVVGAFFCIYMDAHDPGALAFRCRSGRRLAFGYWTRRRPFRGS